MEKEDEPGGVGRARPHSFNSYVTPPQHLSRAAVYLPRSLSALYQDKTETGIWAFAVGCGIFTAEAIVKRNAAAFAGCIFFDAGCCESNVKLQTIAIGHDSKLKRSPPLHNTNRNSTRLHAARPLECKGTG